MDTSRWGARKYPSVQEVRTTQMSRTKPHPPKENEDNQNASKSDEDVSRPYDSSQEKKQDEDSPPKKQDEESSQKKQDEETKQDGKKPDDSSQEDSVEGSLTQLNPKKTTDNSSTKSISKNDDSSPDDSVEESFTQVKGKKNKKTKAKNGVKNKEKNGRTAPKSKTKRSGLCLNVGSIKSALRRKLPTQARFSNGVDICIASVLESAMERLWIATQEQTISSKLKTVSPTHLYQAILSDTEFLKPLFNGFTIMFSGRESVPEETLMSPKMLKESGLGPAEVEKLNKKKKKAKGKTTKQDENTEAQDEKKKTLPKKDEKKKTPPKKAPPKKTPKTGTKRKASTVKEPAKKKQKKNDGEPKKVGRPKKKTTE